MKKSILAIAVLVLFSMTSYSQSNFTVDNQTDCNVDVVITAWNTVCNDCNGNALSPTASGTATANTQTQITTGGGPGGEWGKIEITLSGGGGPSIDGAAVSNCPGASGSLVCNAEDIYVVWLDCSNAEVKKQ